MLAPQQVKRDPFPVRTAACIGHLFFFPTHIRHSFIHWHDGDLDWFDRLGERRRRDWLCKCTGETSFLGSNVQCMFCFETCNPEGRGRKGRECKFQTKAHITFAPRNTFSPVLRAALVCPRLSTLQSALSFCALAIFIRRVYCGRSRSTSLF